MAKGSPWINVLLVSMLVWCGIPAAHALTDEKESLFKGIDLGPGKLDMGGSLRLRYEYFDNYNIKT